MLSRFKLLIIFILGLAVGIFWGQRQAKLTPEILKKLTALSNQEIEEYHQLLGLKEKYEKADEILGKMVLIFLADLGIHTSDKTAKLAQEATQGKHPPAQTSPAVTTVGVQPTPSAPLVSIDKPETATTQPYTKPNPRPTQPQPSPKGVVPWGRIQDHKGWNACKSGQEGWFISGENPKDYQIGFDAQSADTAFISALHDKNRPESVELDHCITPPFTPGQKIQVTALIKAEGVRDYANIHVRAKNPHGENLANIRKNFSGTFDWKPLRVEIEVPPDASVMSYGILLESVGKIWIKQVTLNQN